MCGITGTISSKNGTADIAGVNRLQENNLTIVLDGRLFNKKELSQKLKLDDGLSDTEVLLAAFIKWNKKCVSKLNGAFAFAVWNDSDKSFFAARDHMGIKPFFFKKTDDGLVFASDLRALFKNPLCPALIDKNGINQLFLLGPGRISGSGVFKGINELLPGEQMFLSQDGLQRQQYFKLKARPHREGLKQTIEHLRALVFDAIESQLVDDKLPACFLSGGLDSSIITYAVAQKAAEKGKALSTFSIDFKDNEKNFVKNAFQTGSDTESVRLMTKFAATKHKSIMLESDAIFESLREAAIARGLPGMGDIDSSLLLGAREVRKAHEVILSGECADELLAGYPWYFDDKALNDSSFPWARSLDIRKNLLKKEFLMPAPEKFVSNLIKQTIDETEVLPNECEQDKRMRRMFMLNIRWFMQTLLDRSDRMARSCGLELRVPFCDWRIAEYAYNIPWSFKALHGREKGLLREAFKGVLPDEIVNRKKNPFPKTFDPKYFELVKNGAVQAVNRGGLLSKIIDKEYLNTLLNQSTKEIEPWYGQLMRLPQVLAMLIQMDYIFEEFNVKLA